MARQHCTSSVYLECLYNARRYTGKQKGGKDKVRKRHGRGDKTDMKGKRGRRIREGEVLMQRTTGRRPRNIGKEEVMETPWMEMSPHLEGTSQDASQPQRNSRCKQSKETRFIQTKRAICPVESRMTDGGRRGGGTLQS